VKFKPEFIRVTDQGTAKLCREYTDLTGKRRTLIYDHEGPVGSRWITEDGSMITVDEYLTKVSFWERNNRGQLVYKELQQSMNPWDRAIDVKDSWVLEQ